MVSLQSYGILIPGYIWREGRQSQAMGAVQDIYECENDKYSKYQ